MTDEKTIKGGEKIVGPPKETEIARHIISDDYPREQWIHHLRGMSLKRIDVDQNLWDVYRFNPEPPHEYVDTINVDAIGSANLLLGFLTAYGGPRGDGDSDQEPDDSGKGNFDPSMVY